MNFKDLQFSLGKLSSDVKSHMAKKNPLHKQDTKALSVWIFQERNDLATMRTLAYRRGETNKSFREWTTNGHEYWNDDDEFTDIQDIGDKLATLLTKANEIEQNYTARYQQYRHAIKSIREREDALCDTREKRRSLSSRLNHLQKTNPHSPKRHDIESDLAALDHDTQRAEIELGDFKRFALKEAFYIRFNAMVEYADKLKMIAGFGKYIVDLLDVEPTQEPARKPYTSETQASLILNDCLLALDQWVPDQEDERPTFLANQDIVDDEDANVLTEEDIRYYREQGLASLKAPPSLGNKTNDGDQQPPLYVDDGHQWNDEKKPPGIQQQPLLTAKQEQVEQTRKNDNHPPAYSPSISNISPATSITEPTAGLVCSDTHHLPTSSFSSAHVYHPQLEGCQLDYYQVYRNKLLHTPHQPRSYASFQQQFVSNRSKENIPSE